MKSAIISVGTELLFGKVVNTNAAYLSQELNEMGIDVLYHYTMGDNPARLKRMLEFAMEDCDLLLITGGLGPTEDDLTKETVCEFMGQELVLDEEALRSITEYFSRTKFVFTENNRKQAFMPAGGTTFLNTAGTAPGFAVEKEGKCIICMPGVPREMKVMFQKSAKPYLMQKADACIYSKSVKVFAVGESMVETMLLPFIDGQTDPTIATYAKDGVVEVRVTSKRRTEEEAKAAAEEMAASVCEVLGDAVFSTDGLEIHEEVVNRLVDNNISVSCCEAPTAGMFASWLGKVPGVSAVFDGGYVLYGNGSGSVKLDAPAELEPAGAEMAEFLVKTLSEQTGSRLSIAITGAAGPDPAGDTPVGTYHIAVIFDGDLILKSYSKTGRTRELNREFMTQTMFDLIRRIIDGKSTDLPEKSTAKNL